MKTTQIELRILIPGHTTVIQTLQDQSAKRLFSHQLLEIFEMFK